MKSFCHRDGSLPQSIIFQENAFLCFWDPISFSRPLGCERMLNIQTHANGSHWVVSQTRLQMAFCCEEPLLDFDLVGIYSAVDSASAQNL